jgi:hypothetical protein
VLMASSLVTMADQGAPADSRRPREERDRAIDVGLNVEAVNREPYRSFPQRTLHTRRLQPAKRRRDITPRLDAENRRAMRALR